MPAAEPAGVYDLANDIGEAKNLSAARPEELQELTRLYESWNAQSAGTSLAAQLPGKGRRGRAPKPQTPGKKP